MLQNTNRLRTEKDISRVFNHGRKFNSGVIGITVVPSRIEAPRFAVVVGSKVAKRAVQRNKIKRRLRETIRLFLKRGAIRKNIDVVVNARGGASDRGLLGLKEDLVASFARGRILTERVQQKRQM